MSAGAASRHYLMMAAARRGAQAKAEGTQAKAGSSEAGAAGAGVSGEAQAKAGSRAAGAQDRAKSGSPAEEGAEGAPYRGTSIIRTPPLPRATICP